MMPDPDRLALLNFRLRRPASGPTRTPCVLHMSSKRSIGDFPTVGNGIANDDMEHTVNTDTSFGHDNRHAATLADETPAPIRDASTARTYDADQLSAAYQEHRAALFGFARRRLGDIALAEEAVQETFLRAWRSIHRFDPTAGSAKMWLFGICRNTAIDLARRRAREARVDQVIDESTVVSDGGLGRLMTRWQTEHALKRMTAPQRHSVVHVHLHGRPYADVAAELGVPVGTIKSRVHVGLQAARAEVA